MKNKKSKKLWKKFQKLIPKGVMINVPRFIIKAKGATVTDADGNRFIDLSSGISSVNLGHNNPKVVKAIQNQSKKFLHTCFIVAPYENYLQLAEELHKITPGKFPKKTFLANSGAEAVENAVKIARTHTGRPAIVSFTHGFHGRTNLTMALTSKIKPYKFGFGPFAPEIYKLPYPYTYRRPAHCQTENDYADYLLNQIEEEFFHGVVDPEHIAAIIIEPIAGEGGFIVAPPRYLRGLSKICKKYGIVFIVDEVQTGFCRTGKWFACEWSGIEPDIIVLAKSIASGMPLSAVVGKKKIMDSVRQGGLGGTFGGNPVSVAAALATIREMKRLNLPKLAQKLGQEIEKVFNELAKTSPLIGEARGKGAMMALEIIKKGTKSSALPGVPDKTQTGKFIQKIADQGVIILSSGILGNDLRVLPPLTITKKELRKALKVIQKTIL